MAKVITYQTPGALGERINLTRQQIAMLEAAGKWPRNERGEEYCSVSMGQHWGEPSMTDDELREYVGI